MRANGWEIGHRLAFFCFPLQMKEENMAIKYHQQILLSQNFLKSANLVRSLIHASSIGPGDTVLDIGAGGGIITAELARIARKVIAIEKDPSYAMQLREQYQTDRNVVIVEKDFMQYHICDQEFKIFANIPYNITSDILRKLLYTAPMPKEAYLILQKKAAAKFAGTPIENQFSVLAKPRFSFQIVRQLRRTDFDPVPSVDSVLLCIKKRSPPLIGEGDFDSYRRFIQYGFGKWRKNLKCIFKSVFTYAQWKHLSHELGFALNATPTDLTFEQWLGLFNYYRRLVGKCRGAQCKC
jgi:23S rRNA (adenine-N6)-dimethyltransferase